MKKEEIDNLILGGGVSGMSCAMELYNHDKKCLVIEKENKVGGLAKTLSFKEEGELNFKTDIGPHRFFSKKDYLYKFVKNILDDDWILVNRKTRQFIDGKFYDYPIKPIQAFKNVGLVKTLKIIFSYLKGYFTYNIFNKKIENFEDFIVANFGRELGEFN
ncbi:MAG: NAD(P)-binding protein, partial [Candidatus Woesearchaeota archaeon]